MTPFEALQQHRQVCDELYELALEENRFLQQNQRAPDTPFLDRKRAALARLDETLGGLRATPPGGTRDPEVRAALDKARSRIMQILQIDRENEQLLLRHSLGRGANQEASAPVSPGPTLLQRIYSRHS
jgi:hypothetical protein